jgi:lipoprotein Spr
LHNRYFINASTTNGVSLANLDDPYWKKRFVAAGRVKIEKREATNGKGHSTIH